MTTVACQSSDRTYVQSWPPSVELFSQQDVIPIHQVPGRLSKKPITLTDTLAKGTARNKITKFILCPNHTSSKTITRLKTLNCEANYLPQSSASFPASFTAPIGFEPRTLETRPQSNEPIINQLVWLEIPMLQ